MIIDIKGHSGCNIDIIEDNGNLYVKKSTNDIKYLDRLNLQAEKQKNDNCLSDSLRNPVIHDVVKTENECYMVMDYIYAKNFIDYFENASPSDINHFIDTFINYINDELSKCKIENINKNVFINKFDSVVSNCFTVYSIIRFIPSSISIFGCQLYLSRPCVLSHNEYLFTS